MYLKRITSIFSIIMIFMFTIGQSLLPIVANAQELNTTGVVDSFTFDKEKLGYYERMGIKVEFSEKPGNRIKPGDTLTLTLPPELKGFSDTIQLDDYGTCKVNAGTVVCTFNDKVESEKDIQGHFYFTVQSTYAEIDQENKVETNLGTILDKQSVTVTGPSGGGGTDPGKGPFSYKGGEIRPENTNEVHWYLIVNYNKEVLSNNIDLTDTLQGGQTLNKDSFYFDYDNGNPEDRKTLSLEKFVAEGYGKIQFNSDETSFSVEINKDKASGNTVTIGYKANITESGKNQKDLENKYTIKYQVKGEDLLTNSDDSVVENIISGGGAGGNKTTSVSGTKKWNDNNATDRPTTIKVDLLQNGKVVDTKEVTAEKDWKYEFKELAVFDKNGAAYEYKVEEQPVLGYESKVEGYDITNTKVVQTTNISGTKKWEDYNNKFNKRPGSITVQLLQGDKVIQDTTVKADEKGNWNFSFKDLPKYDGQGNEIKYTVSEVKVDGYETKVEGTTITNTYKNTDKTEVNGKKVWEDYNNKFNKRPGSITVQLLQGDKVIQDTTVKADEKGNWNFSFKDLPKYDGQGNEIKYAVNEVKVEGYETKVEGTTITNTYKNTDKTEVNGKKVWEDYNNKFNTRPGSIKVQLLQGDKVIQDTTVKADEKGNWNFSFKDLPKYDGQGNEIQYKVSEVKVDGYETKVEGTTITNTYKNTDKTEVNGKKVWEDYNNKFNTRPGSIKVELHQDDKVIQDTTVKADEKGNWSFSFKDLPKYDGQGNEIQYKVSEVKVDGYETKVEGTTITNTYKNTETTEVNGKKVWEDYNNKFNKRPGSITVQLLQGDKVIQDTKVEADKEGNWNFSFKDLPKYDEKGNEIKYTVSEVKVDGYETKVEGTTITNTYKNTETTEVNGKKVWEDYNNKFNKRPGSITVQLLQGDKVIQDTKVEADKEGNWNFSFKDLPKYDGQGNEIQYAVNEVKVEGYETKVEGTTITNTYKNTETTEVNGKKVWEDYNNKFNKRPGSITVQLLQDDKVIQDTTVKADEKGNWSFSFKDLPKYDRQGNEIQYKVSEVKVDGYETKVEGTTITNTYKNTETTEVNGKKVWEDYNNKFNKRPGSIKVELLQDDKVIQDTTVKADEKGNWNFSFKDLPKYDGQGNEIQYKVSEVKVDGYETKVEGTTITNTYKNTDKTEVSGKKVWEDYNNKFNKRPGSITVQLLQGDKVIQDTKVEADKEGNWNFSFKDLPKYDEKGNEIKYTVSEVKVDGYETKVEGTTITNTYKNTDKTEVNGKKVWEDYNNKFNTRPGSIKVELLQSDKVIQDTTVKADEKGNWSFSFKDLPKYDGQGNEIQYKVSEVKVDGYETKVEGTTITNTYKNTDKTEVNGKKVWEDYNNKFNTRPGSITVQLLQGDKVIQDTKVEADKEGNWNFSFKDLPKYDEKGNEIKYTVSEVKVDGYETKVEGTTITNTYKNTDKTEVSGKKVWEDYNNKFNTRPGSIKVQLLQNGTEFKTEEVKADKEGNWNFSFKDLPKYDGAGNEFTYTVDEVKVDDYETKVEGTTITNTYKNTDKTEVSGKKIWDDNNAIDRPLSIKVDLLQNGKVIDTKEVSVATNWKYTFEKLRVYDANGVAYKYEVKEQPVEGYKSEVNGYDITNTKIKDEQHTDPKDPSTDPKDPSTDPKDPSTDPKDPSTDPKDPSTDPKDPSTDPKDPSTDPKDPSTDPKDPSIDPKDPSTDPKDPSTDPKDPSTDPKDPSTDPKDPSTGKNSDSQVPPTTEKDKPTLLPNTGGTSTEMISIFGGMLLFLLGGSLIARRRIK
ncbi:hypothetical protein BJR06_25230 [Bacillus cereus]|nr:hypothetical protein BJR06_25230 [Bacillus cereus]